MMVEMIRGAVADRSELLDRIDAAENAIVALEMYLMPLGFKHDNLSTQNRIAKQAAVALPPTCPPSVLSPTETS